MNSQDSYYKQGSSYVKYGNIVQIVGILNIKTIWA